MSIQSIGPRLTNSQRELFNLATEPTLTRSEVAIIKIEAGHAGVSYAARMAERTTLANTRAPRCVRLLATSAWDAAICLVKVAGKECYGIGYIDIMERCFKALSNNGQRQLCIILDRAGRMNVRDQEDFAARAEWCATHHKINVRVIYLLQKVKTWDPERQKHVRDWVYSAQLKQSATEYGFSADGLDELLGHEDADTNDLRQVKFA